MLDTNNSEIAQKEKEKEQEQEIKIQLLEKEMKNPKELKNKLLDLYLLEFEENFSDILIQDKTKYLDRFGEKMSLILLDKFGDACFDDEDFLTLINSEDLILSHRGFSWLAGCMCKGKVFWDAQNPPKFKWTQTKKINKNSSIACELRYFGQLIDLILFAPLTNISATCSPIYFFLFLNIIPLVPYYKLLYGHAQSYYNHVRHTFQILKDTFQLMFLLYPPQA